MNSCVLNGRAVAAAAAAGDDDDDDDDDAVIRQGAALMSCWSFEVVESSWRS